jgi:hypothetical protein
VDHLMIRSAPVTTHRAGAAGGPAAAAAQARAREGVVAGLIDVWLRALPEDVRTADTGDVPRLDREDLRRALAARDDG